MMQMLAPLGTLAFLATLWLLTVVGAAVLEESGARIAAALKGKSAHHPAFASIRMRARSRVRRPMRAAPRWRDAA
jgi:predicted deacetylase